MSEIEIIAIGKDAITTVLLVASPVLGCGILVGLLVSIFQATTQIQEQTLTFIPKIMAVLGSLVIFGPWMLRNITNFARSLYENLHLFIS